MSCCLDNDISEEGAAVIFSAYYENKGRTFAENN
jgi:hypothetical protein